MGGICEAGRDCGRCQPVAQPDCQHRQQDHDFSERVCWTCQAKGTGFCAVCQGPGGCGTSEAAAPVIDLKQSQSCVRICEIPVGKSNGIRFVCGSQPQFVAHRSTTFWYHMYR